ncbi:hypothetical protein GCM10027258_77720 [Amycolatopsis stemonae]
MTKIVSSRTATAVGFARPSEVDRMVRMPSRPTVTTRFSWLIAATTVPPWKAKSSTGPRPVATTRPGPPASGNRTSVPRSRLDTQTAPSWTLIPLAPKPVTGASKSPVAKAETRPRETRQTVEPNESATKRSPVTGSRATPFWNPAGGSAATWTGGPPGRIR